MFIDKPDTPNRCGEKQGPEKSLALPPKTSFLPPIAQPLYIVCVSSRPVHIFLGLSRRNSLWSIYFFDSIFSIGSQNQPQKST